MTVFVFLGLVEVGVGFVDGLGDERLLIAGVRVLDVGQLVYYGLVLKRGVLTHVGGGLSVAVGSDQAADGWLSSARQAADAGALPVKSANCSAARRA